MLVLLLFAQERGDGNLSVTFCCAWESQDGRAVPGGFSGPGKLPSGGGGWVVQAFHSNKLKPGTK